MVFKRFLIAATLLLSACQFAPSLDPPSTATAIPPSPVKATATTSPVIQITLNGVTIQLNRPDGWEADEDDKDKGLMMAEPNGGMFVLCSTDDGNGSALAWLHQVVGGSKGWDAAMTQPVSFIWDHLNAAYYLFTTGEGVRALVIAIALPGQNQVVVCTISVPTQQAARIRTEVTQLLDGMMINSTTLHGSGLNSLPNPLPFPRYMSPSATPQATAIGTAQP